MHFEDTTEEKAFREEARTWIDGNAPRYLQALLSALGPIGGHALGDYDPLAEAKKWQKTKADAGWACLTWPKEFGGRDATRSEAAIWGQEEGDYARLSIPFMIGIGMCGPTLMTYASGEQKRQYLPRIASGEHVWCQLFSEPHSGSDLAGLRTRAVEDGDEWVVNGQKLWTSGAQLADYGILLARTDPNVPKHKGLTMFFIDMKSSGIDVRPIVQMNGQSDFCEVHFDGMRIPDAQRLGDVGGGWKVSLTTLMNERVALGHTIATGFEEFLDHVSALPTASGKAVESGSVRAKLAHWYAQSAGIRNLNLRSLSALSKGEQPGPESSIIKIVVAAMMQDMAKCALDLHGLAGVVSETDASPGLARMHQVLMRSPAVRIEGGSDQILRNVVAERILGLPEEMRIDKNVPFNKIPTDGSG